MFNGRLLWYTENTGIEAQIFVSCTIMGKPACHRQLQGLMELAPSHQGNYTRRKPMPARLCVNRSAQSPVVFGRSLRLTLHKAQRSSVAAQDNLYNGIQRNSCPAAGAERPAAIGFLLLRPAGQEDRGPHGFGCLAGRQLNRLELLGLCPLICQLGNCCCLPLISQQPCRMYAAIQDSATAEHRKVTISIQLHNFH